MPDSAATSEHGQRMYTSSMSIRAADSGATDDELMELIRARATDPSVFESRPPFVWRVEASSSRLDSYYTKMHSTSLKNYAKDAKDGVMFLDSHVKRQLGYGQSVFGEYIEGDLEDDRKPATMKADFFTIPGIKLGAADTDSFIDAVRASVIRDVSIGFIPGRFECNLCGRDPYDWWSLECMHIPGAYYDPTGKEVTSKSKGTLAFAWVKDARLSEVSAVFDGATPGAHVEKAKFLVERGQLSRSAAVTVERQLQVRLPTVPMLVPTIAIKDGKLTIEQGEAIVNGERALAGTEMEMSRKFRRLGTAEERNDDPVVADDTAANENTEPAGEATQDDPTPQETEGGEAMTEEEARALRERAERAEGTLAAIQTAARAGLPEGQDSDPVSVITSLRGQVAELRPLAQLGEDYRANTIADAVKEGIRAFGTDFNETETREMLDRLDIAHVRKLKDEWAKIAEAKMPTGRKTTDVTTEPGRRSPNGIGTFAQYRTP